MISIRFTRRVAFAIALAALSLNVAADQPPLVVGIPLYHGPLEKNFVDIETSIPGFAGWYMERNGDAVALVKDISRAGEALERVRQIVEARGITNRRPGKDSPTRPRNVTVRKVKYSFSELAGFRHLICQELPDGVYVIDVDEVNNVVAFGVRDDEVTRELHGVAGRLHIPAAALRIYLEQAPESRSSLTAYHRPVNAGLGITFGSSTCTVAANAIWDNDPNWSGFMTASHCGSPWTNGGTVFYQGGYRVGAEVDDPAPTALYGCPSGELCRYSDVTFVNYDSGERASANGENTVATTNSANYAGAGSTEFYESVTIAGDSAPAVNDMVDKVGATTGWTFGYISATCQMALSDHQYWTGTQWKNVRLLCQERSDVFSAGGDSGSPVFTYTQPGGVFTAWLAGVIWGGPTQYESFHSSVWNIQQDFPDYTFYY